MAGTCDFCGAGLFDTEDYWAANWEDRRANGGLFEACRRRRRDVRLNILDYRQLVWSIVGPAASGGTTTWRRCSFCSASIRYIDSSYVAYTARLRNRLDACVECSRRIGVVW